jgi:hypothetical protein
MATVQSSSWRSEWLDPKLILIYIGRHFGTLCQVHLPSRNTLNLTECFLVGGSDRHVFRGAEYDYKMIIYKMTCSTFCLIYFGFIFNSKCFKNCESVLQSQSLFWSVTYRLDSFHLIPLPYCLAYHIWSIHTYKGLITIVIHAVTYMWF